MLASYSCTASSDSYDLIDMEMQFLSRIMTTIESQQWEALGNAILNNPDVFRMFARSIASSLSKYMNGMTILHACVRYNPPPEILKILLDLVPEAPACVDIAGRTPLHVAVGMRANISAIKILVSAYPDACAMLDCEGKTPLHLACDGDCDLFEKEEDEVDSIPKKSPCLHTIETLINACPLAAVLEDQDRMTALEYAIISDASMKIVWLLQCTTGRQCMKLDSYFKRAMSDEPILDDESTNHQLNSRSKSL